MQHSKAFVWCRTRIKGGDFKSKGPPFWLSVPAFHMLMTKRFICEGKTWSFLSCYHCHWISSAWSVYLADYRNYGPIDNTSNSSRRQKLSFLNHFKSCPVETTQDVIASNSWSLKRGLQLWGPSTAALGDDSVRWVTVLPLAREAGLDSCANRTQCQPKMEVL